MSNDVCGPGCRECESIIQLIDWMVCAHMSVRTKMAERHIGHHDRSAKALLLLAGGLSAVSFEPFPSDLKVHVSNARARATLHLLK